MPPFVPSGKGMLAIAVPEESQGTGRWSCSDHLTALHTLAAIAITKALLVIGSAYIYNDNPVVLLSSLPLPHQSQ